MTVTVEEHKNVLCKVTVVQKILFTNVWQNLTTFHQKHTLTHQKVIGKHVTTITLNPLETWNIPKKQLFRDFLLGGFKEQKHTSSRVTVVHWKKPSNLFKHPWKMPNMPAQEVINHNFKIPGESFKQKVWINEQMSSWKQVSFK